jgi:hypothetical protein
MFALKTVLLYSHTAIELLAGGLMFSRGAGTHEQGKQQGKQTGKDRLYRRWHGAGLLSLSFMGALAIRADESTPAGAALVANTISVCAVFHSLANAAMLISIYDESTTSWSSFLLNPHICLAAGFIYAMNN